MAKKQIINVSELEFQKRPAAMGKAPEGYEAELAFVGPMLGAKLLGTSVTKVPPGNRAFPLHNHRVNEELFFILEGIGEVRIGDERFPIKKGDFLSCPPGGPATAHQIINTGDADMTYIGISTKLSPEIAEYPDSGTGKFGILADFGADTEGKPQGFRYIGKTGDNGDYWEGEEAK